jgi:FG-GAP repeat
MFFPTHLLLAVRQVARTATGLAAACVALALLSAVAGASPAAAAEQRLTTTGTAAGYSTAVDGDTLVLGDPLDNGGVGAVYVFQRSGDAWTNTATLTASDGSADDNLGISVAIDGDTIVAGASGDGVDQDAAGQGSVYTFARSGAPRRTQTAKLTDAEAAEHDELGYSVAIDGDTIVAGAPGRAVGINATQGVVDTFARTGADRTQTARLIVPDGAAKDRLGTSVAIDGDGIVAGAPNAAVGENAEQGALYKFSRAGATQRGPAARLTATPGAASAHLGSSVDMDGDTVVGGAPGAPLATARARCTRSHAPARRSASRPPR